MSRTEIRELIYSEKNQAFDSILRRENKDSKTEVGILVKKNNLVSIC